MTSNEAMAFVAKEGVVLVSAKGAVPSLTEAIVGEPIQGSWWGHPKSHQIFAILQVLTESEDILVCRLVQGKVTLVHRRLWPALVRVAKRFPPAQVAQVRQEHTPSGSHVNREVPFPKWVPGKTSEQAGKMDEQEALNALGPWTRSAAAAQKKTSRKVRAR
ncbi:MAG: hypothetical protein ABI596_13030 [Pyrinomonadaceae bacterium]